MKNLTIFLLIFMGVLRVGHSQTVTIGTQVWSTKNLDVSTFMNGEAIPQVTTDEEWDNAGENEQPAWCYYDNDPTNGTKYGKLYNWFAVNDSRGLAPDGYHIPTDEEWTILTDYLGESAAGKKMKCATGWKSYTNEGLKECPNCASWNAEYRSKVPCHICKDTRSVSAPTTTISGNGSNSSGFAGLPAGIRFLSGGGFGYVGSYGVYWSSSELDTYSAWNRCLFNDHVNVVRGPGIKDKGHSVRCLRD